MAKVPIFRKLNVEDFENQKDWIGDLISPINDFFTTVGTALNKTLSFTDNLNTSIKDVTAKGGEVIKLLNPIKNQTQFQVPQGVLLIKVQVDSNTPTPISTTYSIYWDYDFKNNFVNITVNGLSAVTKYKFRFLIIGA